MPPLPQAIQLVFDFLASRPHRSIREEPGLPEKLATAPADEAESTPETRSALAQEQTKLLALAKDLFRGLNCQTLAQRVQVAWNGRLKSGAGRALRTECRVELNPRLRAFPGEVDRTLRHELAHLLAWDRNGRRRIPPHGAEWQEACRDLGIPDETVCHSLPLPTRQHQRRHQYQCPSCGQIMARVRPLRRPSACLPCCKKHNNGQYDGRFRFQALKSGEGNLTSNRAKK